MTEVDIYPRLLHGAREPPARARSATGCRRDAR